MTSTIDWREQGPGVVVISQSGIGTHLARLLGLPFLYFGGYLLYNFLAGALRPSSGGLTLFGWTLLPLLAVALLVPGWAIVFARKRVRIDATRREATDELDFLIYTRRRTTAIPADAHVMLRYEVGSNKDAGAFAHVYLVPAASARSHGARGVPGADPVRLAMFSTKQDPEALELAQRVARFLGIAVEDRRVDGGEIASGGVVVDRLDSDEAD